MIGVDCVFNVDGSLTVRQLNFDGSWISVEQGRQWIDQEGWHVLIRLLDQGVRELVLRADLMNWELRPGKGQVTILV